MSSSMCPTSRQCNFRIARSIPLELALVARLKTPLQALFTGYNTSTTLKSAPQRWIGAVATVATKKIPVHPRFRATSSTSTQEKSRSCAGAGRIWSFKARRRTSDRYCRALSSHHLCQVQRLQLQPTIPVATIRPSSFQAAGPGEDAAISGEPKRMPGQGTEGHLVLDFKTEVGPPVQIQKTMVILTKITVFDEKVLLFIYVQSDSSM